jgi:protease IV
MEFARESIFMSALRSFCKSFTSVLGVLLAILIISFGVLSLGSNNLLPPPSEATIHPDAQGNRKPLPLSAPAILFLNIDGVIGLHDLRGEKVRNILLDSQEGILAGNRVKGILVRFNTPGGTVDDSDEIYRALKEYETKYNVPIYGFVEGLCASGGMYIASAVQKIFATTPSIIGSIGVRFGPAFNFVGTMEKYGVQAVTLTEGKDKDALNPFRMWQPGEAQSLQEIIAAQYTHFVDLVTSSRKNLNKEELIKNYGAHIFIDDANSSYEAALTALVQAAGLSADQPYQVIELSSPQNLLSQLSTSDSLLSLLAQRLIGTAANDPLQALKGKFLYLYEPAASAVN